jgi:hypothetical protein
MKDIEKHNKKLSKGKLSPEDIEIWKKIKQKKKNWRFARKKLKRRKKLRKAKVNVCIIAK